MFTGMFDGMLGSLTFVPSDNTVTDPKRPKQSSATKRQKARDLPTVHAVALNFAPRQAPRSLQTD